MNLAFFLLFHRNESLTFSLCNDLFFWIVFIVWFFFAILHLRVLDGVGGSDVVFAAAVPTGTPIFFNVRVVGRDSDEEVNCANNDDYRGNISCDVSRKSLVSPAAEGFELLAADLVGVGSDGVVAGFEASLAIVSDGVATFVVKNRQNEDWNGQNAAQRDPSHVDDVPQTEHDPVGNTTADVVRFFATKKVSPRWSRRQERDGEENARNEHHSNANAQHHSLDQVQREGKELILA